MHLVRRSLGYLGHRQHMNNKKETVANKMGDKKLKQTTEATTSNANHEPEKKLGSTSQPIPYFHRQQEEAWAQCDPDGKCIPCEAFEETGTCMHCLLKMSHIGFDHPCFVGFGPCSRCRQMNKNIMCEECVHLCENDVYVDAYEGTCENCGCDRGDIWDTYQ